MTNSRNAESDDQTLQILTTLLERVSASTKRTREGQVTYVIGNNGTGKSRILGELAEHLKNAKPARSVACISNSIYDRFKYGDSGLIRYLGARNAPNAVFHSAIERQLSRFILQSMLLDRRLFTRLSEAVHMDLSFSLGRDVEMEVKKLLDFDLTQTRTRGRGKGKARTHADLLTSRPLAMLKRIAEGDGRFDHLTEAQLPVFLRYLDLTLDIDLHVRLPDGSSIGFKDLSTGEQNRTLLFAKILSAMEEGAVFLIDEPEISLHLHWQMEFHRTLMKLVSGLRRFHVVVATHAPIIISEAARIDQNRQRNVVMVLRRVLSDGDTPGEQPPGSAPVTCDIHTFTDVASHEQLVLRYFQTAPYHAHEVSFQIADAVLRVAEDAGAHRRGAEELLREIRNAVGLSDEAKAQIDSAIELIQEKLVPSIQRALVPSTKETV
ncbi:AAA family ATPase [Paraburkholderia caribensis]|nr:MULTISPECIES: AAA family ATPase [Paraburkholderia]MCO4881764.1 ATP-binding protein [Paraburkholderia caribensis]